MLQELEKTNLQVPHNYWWQETYNIVKNLYGSLRDEFPQSRIVEVQRHELCEGTRYLSLGGYGISEGGNVSSVRVLQENRDVWKVEQPKMIKMSTCMRIGDFMEDSMDIILGREDPKLIRRYTPLLPHEQPGNLLMWLDGEKRFIFFHLIADW